MTVDREAPACRLCGGREWKALDLAEALTPITAWRDGEPADFMASDYELGTAPDHPCGHFVCRRCGTTWRRGWTLCDSEALRLIADAARRGADRLVPKILACRHPAPLAAPADEEPEE